MESGEWRVCYRIRGSPKGSVLYVLGRTDHFESTGDGSDGVAVRHPHLRVLVEILKERVRSIYRLQIGTSVFARIGLLDLATEGMTDKLRTIADAQDWDTAYELRQIDLKSLRVVYRIG